MAESLAFLVAAYLAASISFPQLLARAYGVDLHVVGTRNLGGGNAMREVGVLPGLAGAILDALKPPVVMLAATVFGFPRETVLASGVAAIVAQLWPVWHRFDGGRGNAPTLALWIALSLPTAALVLPLVVLGATWSFVARRLNRRVWSRGMPLGVLAGLIAYPLMALRLGEDAAVVGAAAATSVLVMIRRLTAGIREDLEPDADLARVVLNRFLYDRTEEQRRVVEGS